MCARPIAQVEVRLEEGARGVDVSCGSTHTVLLLRWPAEGGREALCTFGRRAGWQDKARAHVRRGGAATPLPKLANARDGPA